MNFQFCLPSKSSPSSLVGPRLRSLRSTDKISRQNLYWECCIVTCIMYRNFGSRDSNWPEHLENVELIPSADFIWWSYQYLKKERLFLFRIWVRHGSKRSAFDVFDTFATQSGLVHDVTDADPWAWNGSTRGHVFADLKKRDQKSIKNCSVSIFLLFHYYPYDRWCFSLRLPYNNCFRGFLSQSWWKQTLIMLCALHDPLSEAFWAIFSFGVPFPSPCEGGIYR